MAHGLGMLGEVERGRLGLRRRSLCLRSRSSRRRRRRSGLRLGGVVGVRVCCGGGGVERVRVVVGEADRRRVPLQRPEGVHRHHRHLVQLLLQLRDDVHLRRSPPPPRRRRSPPPLSPPIHQGPITSRPVKENGWGPAQREGASHSLTGTWAHG